MAKVAKTEPDATVVMGDHVFQFGPDGTRNVTAAEAELLQTSYSGPLKIEIVDQKSTKKGRS